MEKIPSFKVNHLTLKRGIYVSRKDVTANGDVLTTFDIRMKEPNREPALSISSLHAIEHLAATYLRNHEIWKDKVVYWGPMGCCTGNYLILKGDYESKDVVALMTETFEFISQFDGDVPGANARDCGNYLMMNLPMARWEALKYLKEVLCVISKENLEYPD